MVTYTLLLRRGFSRRRVRPRGWLDALSPPAAAKVATATLRLEQGNTSRVKWFGGLGELVIDWGPGYRVYLARDGEALIVLFGGGTKRRQQSDIDRAQALLAEYKSRKAARIKTRQG